MARSFRQTGLGTTTATVTTKMVVTVMMVMFHCVLVHSASRYDLATLPADSSLRDSSSRQLVGDVHSTGAQYGTGATQSDEHFRTSDTLTSQSNVPRFVTSRSNKRVFRRRRTIPRVTTPVRTMIVRRETKEGESALVNTQTTTSAAKTDLMSTSEHLANDTSTVLTTTEMSRTFTTTKTTTRRPLVLGDTCSSSSDCQKHINRSSCTGVCVCAKGYFQRETRCYAEPRNLTVTQRNDYVDISWDGDDIEYTVYINISSKFNTTFKMFIVIGTQIDFSPSHPGTVIRAMVTVSGSNRFTVKANVTIAPSSPQRLNITFVNDTCLEAKWAPGTGVTEQYLVDVIQLGKTTRHETTQTTWSYCRLSPGELFNVSVHAMSNSVLSRLPASVFDYTNPSKPRDGRLQATSLETSARVDILWIPGSNKDKEFVVTVENRTDIHPRVLTSWGSWYRSIIHISYGSRYTVNIQAVNHGKKSSPLQLTGCTAPATVERLTVVSSGYNWINLGWTPPAGEVDSFEYEVTVHKPGSRDRVYVTDTILYRVDSLSPEKNYTLKVRVMFCNLTSGYTIVDGATGLEVLDAVENFSGRAHNASCLSLDWGYPVNGNSSDVLEFVMRYRKTPDTSLETIEPSNTSYTSDTSLLLCGLDYFTNYTLSIAAVNKVGEGRVQEKYFHTTEFVPDAVTDLTVHPEVDIKKPRTLSITWKEPVNKFGIIRAYYVIISNSRGIVREEKVLPKDQPYHLHQYLWTEHFTIQVFAETNAGNGSRASSSTQIPEGVLPPTSEEIKVEKSMEEHPATSAVAELPASLLCNHSYGSPVHTGLIVSKSLEQLSGERQTGPVPKVYKSWSEDKSLYYVRVELGHHCQESPGQSFKVLLGGDGNCTKGGQFCNGFLNADTEYRFQAVMCTSAGCTYSPVSSPYRMDKNPGLVPEREVTHVSPTVFVVVVVVCLIVIFCLSAALYFTLKRLRTIKVDVVAEQVDYRYRDSIPAITEKHETMTHRTEIPEPLSCRIKKPHTMTLRAHGMHRC